MQIPFVLKGHADDVNIEGRSSRANDDNAPADEANPSKILGLLKPQQQNCGPQGCAPQKPIQIHNHNEATIGNYEIKFVIFYYNNSYILLMSFILLTLL